MIELSAEARRRVFQAGIVLLLNGAPLAFWSMRHFPTMPNWLRMASALPLLAAIPMLRIDYLARWKSLQGVERARAAMLVVPAGATFVAALAWLLIAPTTRG